MSKWWRVGLGLIKKTDVSSAYRENECLRHRWLIVDWWRLNQSYSPFGRNVSARLGNLTAFLVLSEFYIFFGFLDIYTVRYNVGDTLKISRWNFEQSVRIENESIITDYSSAKLIGQSITRNFERVLYVVTYVSFLGFLVLCVPPARLATLISTVGTVLLTIRLIPFALNPFLGLSSEKLFRPIWINCPGAINFINKHFIFNRGNSHNKWMTT